MESKNDQVVGASNRPSNTRLHAAAAALIADVRRRYPGEELRCPYMRELDAALSEIPSASEKSSQAPSARLTVKAESCEWCREGIPRSKDGLRHESGMGVWLCRRNESVSARLVEPAFHEGMRQSYLKAVEYALAAGVLGDGDKADLLHMYRRLWPRAPRDIRAEELEASEEA